jgi:hypothetical protein
MNTYYPLMAIALGVSFSATAIIGIEIGSGRIE